MQTPVLAWWTACVLSLLGIGACGGNVIVESTNGAGGSGAGPGTGASGVGGGDAEVVCTELCAVGAAFGCDVGGGECVPSCVDGFAAIPSACKDEYAAALACFSDVIPQAGCELVDVCVAEIAVLTDCLSGTPIGCSDVECASSETSCSCKGLCDGETRSAECSVQGDELSCSCYQGGEVAGVCAEPVGQGTACDLDFGCCSGLF
jgi:hypothetical protein